MTGSERGSATVWMLSAILITVAVTIAALAVGAAVLVRHRAATAADEMALAVAGAALQGPSAACDTGAAIARANGAAVESCVLADAIATVRVRIAMPGRLRSFGSATVVARAGPASAGLRSLNAANR